MASTKEVQELLKYINSFPSPFHVFATTRELFTAAGFLELRENEFWSTICKTGGKYFLTRNGSTIVAFAVGKKWKPGNPFSIIAAHTDFPCVRVKPVSLKQDAGYLQVGVEPDGFALWHTLYPGLIFHAHIGFDRDLGIAG
ncbi:hypothetical protein EYZ11_008572 [Aspergillus tanneri]|uniref:aspartyl aminopeptidase n=1 Tax=Aspergillus tanneri TaxID=1220188 RepID=A0A4S3JA58_9EURO|nr:hypothetical protein EYZ11_008572 [Aspergillus tanneri]